MRKLILILLAFIAIFTYIRAFEVVPASDAQSTAVQSTDTLAKIPVEITP
ncbi:hypothetical protein [Treponema sp. R6D11]